jgi:nucleotide-binding universal stress UspA family protein
MAAIISSILVATDFSPASSGAVEYGRILARRFGASMRLLHVVEDPLLAAAWSEAYAFDTSALRERLCAAAEAEIAKLAATLTDVPVTTEVIVGSPARAIIGRSAESDIDLVVMGTHGRGGVSHLLLGSVAERVVHSARCPVLTVREGSGHFDAVPATVPIAVTAAPA